MTALAFLFKLLPEATCAKWWNSQWKRSKVVWDLRGKGQQDVSDCLKFSTEDGDAARAVLAKIGHLPSDMDSKVKFIMARLQNLYDMSRPKLYGGRYETDSKLHKTPDYWQSPSETYASGYGDCDDWGILLYLVLRCADVPAWRLKCNVTEVIQEGKSDGLHFDLLYLAKSDYEWYVLEGTWYPQTAIFRFLSVPRKDSTDKYGLILFTFNEEYTWAQHDFAIRPAFIEPVGRVWG